MGLPVEIYDTDGAAVSFDYPSYVNLTNSTLVKTGAGVFHGLVVGAPGTSITVTVYDNTAGSGTILYGPYVLGTAGTSIEMPGGGFTFATGCYVSFSGTTDTPNISVGYR